MSWGKSQLSMTRQTVAVTYTATSDDLIPDSLMIDVGPNGGNNFIGTKPEK